MSFPKQAQEANIGADLVAEGRWPVKTVSDVPKVPRSNFVEHLKGRSGAPHGHLRGLEIPLRHSPLYAVSVGAVLLLSSVPLSAMELGLPAQCELGNSCFMQQYPDMNPGEEVADPMCGGQSYDGHKGTDLRIRSIKDIEKGYAVVAVSDGEVLRARDGAQDRLIETEDDRAKVSGKECGNGLVLRLSDGYEIQYCHLRQQSLVVKPGQMVRRGDKLGEIGASGLAQFPHVHITVSRNGEVVDPLTGRKTSEGCSTSFQASDSLFSPSIVAKLDLTKPEVLAFGLAGKPLDHQALVIEGPPPQVSSKDNLFVVWGWFINLRKGSIIKLSLKDKDGNIVIDKTSDPLDRNKATFSFFSGKRHSISPGDYEIEVSVMNDSFMIRKASSIMKIN